jgi:hypothetical protein
MKAHGIWHGKVSRPPVATPDATPGCKIGNTTESPTALYMALDPAAYLAGVVPTGAAQKDYTGLSGLPPGTTGAFSADGQTLMTADERRRLTTTAAPRCRSGAGQPTTSISASM